MGVINKYRRVVIAALLAGAEVSAFAQQMKLNDIKGTSGAGTNDLTTLTNKGATTAQAFADLFLVGCALVGIVVFGVSLYGLYKAGKEDRESPKGALWGLGIGGAMTAVPILIGLARNSLSV